MFALTCIRNTYQYLEMTRMAQYSKFASLYALDAYPKNTTSGIHNFIFDFVGSKEQMLLNYCFLVKCFIFNDFLNL